MGQSNGTACHLEREEVNLQGSREQEQGPGVRVYKELCDTVPKPDEGIVTPVPA